MAEAGTLHDAFIDELRDTYDAEKQLTKALAKLAKAAPSGNLSSQPPYTPGIDTVPPLRHAEIACRSACERSVAR